MKNLTSDFLSWTPSKIFHKKFRYFCCRESQRVNGHRIFSSKSLSLHSLGFIKAKLNACDSALSLSLSQNLLGCVEKDVHLHGEVERKLCRETLKKINKQLQCELDIAVTFAEWFRKCCQDVSQSDLRSFFWRETASHVCAFSGANSSWKALTGAVLFDSTWLRKCHMCHPWSTPSVWCILLMFPWCR